MYQSKQMIYSSFSHTVNSYTLSPKKPKIGFQDQLSLNAEHSAILSTFIKLAFVINIFVLSIFEWPFYKGFTVLRFVRKH